MSGPWLGASALLALAHEVTYRQLDHWCNAGLVVPLPRERGGTGHQRRFTMAEVQRVVVMGRLVADGFTPARASQVARWACHRVGPSASAIVQVRLGDSGVMNVSVTQVMP